MKKLVIIFWTPTVVLWGIIGYLKLQRIVRDHYFKQGYDRGQAHARNYFHAYGTPPSKEWGDLHWKYINENDGWIFKKWPPPSKEDTR